MMIDQRAGDDHAIGDARRPRATCSGVEMPKPIASGRSVCARTRGDVSAAAPSDS